MDNTDSTPRAIQKTAHCRQCGIEFPKVTNNAYCSHPCRKDFMRTYHREWKRKNQAPARAARVKETLCKAGCGKIVAYKTNADVYCDNCRLEAVRERSKKAMDRKRREAGAPLGRGKNATCEDCGINIIKANAQHRKCRDCAKAHSAIYAKERQALARSIPGYYVAANKKLKIRKEKDHVLDLSFRTRALICKYFSRQGCKKRSRAQEMLGVDSWQQFADHIERQFHDGMSWDNRSEWHLDHIVPISSATNEADVIALNHYTNLRPMWASENQAKGDKILYLL